MEPVSPLLSFHLLQRSVHNEVLAIWTFPKLSEQYKSMLVKRASALPRDKKFACMRQNEWIYLSKFSVGAKETVLCLVTSEFEPNKYEMLCTALVKNYQKSEDVVELTKLYLSVFTQGSLSLQENGTLTTYDFKKFHSHTNIKDVIRKLGLETILIYTALLLKKRILIYYPESIGLLKVLFSLSKLVSHRNVNDYLYPQINEVPEGKTFFLTGTTHNITTPESYDIYVDFPLQKTTVSAHTKDTFSLSKMHKDLALFLVRLGEDANVNESEIFSKMQSKTKEIIEHLKSLASTTTQENKQVITLDVLRAKNLSPAMENFLFNLAVAENIMML